MSKQVSGEPMYVLPDGAQRVLGRDAMRINIAIGYAVANIVKTTLGPKGMDKMLVSDLGDIVITNDGATILEEMNVDHPAAKLMVEIAKTQDKEVGDGTTTSVVIAGNLLKKAGELIDQNIHPTVIIKGYELASKKAEDVLAATAEEINLDDKVILKQIAMVAMGSKGIGSDREKDKISGIISEAVLQVSTKEGSKHYVDLDFIKIEKKAGGEVMDTELIRGVVVDKEIVHSAMPKSVKNAKVLLLDVALEIEKTETDAKIEITSPENMEAFLHQEEKMMQNMVDKIAATGATFVFCQKGIDDLVQHFLAKKKISAVRRVKKSDMEKLSRATGACIASSLEDLKSDELGSAGLIEEKKISGEAMVFVKECKDPKSVTVFVRGGTDHVVSEVERAVVDARGAVSSALEDGKYVVGGGSVEMEISRELHDYAVQIGGREQLAIQAYAEALESIPRALAENAGMDVIDTIVSLRNKHKEKEGKNVGVDVMNGKVGDLKGSGIFEPAKVKKQALSSATETARLMLRIDDIISSRGGSRGGPGGMPPGGMDMDM
ncbi:TCP-1/cpn60 chaperonin family protein [Candidatus Micrarchaeota archaeon]|nr:TCP-1/cpn60 chaperonin family protein [Candidatus Micrarchaeota archaeon]MBU1166180.1 TCP-1/cpn60 chaperonin family protein [Candidatus Micrarchaeota archaeon]MBU1886578.1 TCP-1/cpn60 chaperonin family protein [Candidatus Micrarchaeota archaeon]